MGGELDVYIFDAFNALWVVYFIHEVKYVNREESGDPLIAVKLMPLLLKYSCAECRRESDIHAQSRDM